MVADFNFPLQLLLHSVPDELHLVQDLQSNYTLRALLSGQVDVAKLAVAQRLSDFEVVNRPQIYVESPVHIFVGIEVRCNFVFGSRLQDGSVNLLRIRHTRCFLGRLLTLCRLHDHVFRNFLLLQDLSLWHRFLLGETEWVDQLLTLSSVFGQSLIDRLLVLTDEVFRRIRSIGQRVI